MLSEEARAARDRGQNIKGYRGSEDVLLPFTLCGREKYSARSGNRKRKYNPKSKIHFSRPRGKAARMVLHMKRVEARGAVVNQAPNFITVRDPALDLESVVRLFKLDRRDRARRMRKRRDRYEAIVADRAARGGVPLIPGDTFDDMGRTWTVSGKRGRYHVIPDDRRWLEGPGLLKNWYSEGDPRAYYRRSKTDRKGTSLIGLRPLSNPPVKASGEPLFQKLVSAASLLLIGGTAVFIGDGVAKTLLSTVRGVW